MGGRGPARHTWKPARPATYVAWQDIHKCSCGKVPGSRFLPACFMPAPPWPRTSWDLQAGPSSSVQVAGGRGVCQPFTFSLAHTELGSGVVPRRDGRAWSRAGRPQALSATPDTQKLLRAPTLPRVSPVTLPTTGSSLHLLWDHFSCVSPVSSGPRPWLAPPRPMHLAGCVGVAPVSGPVP